MRLALLLILTALVACGDIPPANYPTTPPDAENDTTPPLGVGDVFDVVLYNGGAQNKATFRLDTVGRISVQYIGDVVALGKRPNELKDEIQKRLADGYLVDPIVAVNVTEVNSLSVSLPGEVDKRGRIKFTPAMTVVDAIALSGGFTPMAKKNHVKVIRVVEGKELTYKIPVGGIQDGVRPNFYLAAGDRIFVPERLW